jgi:hypothetical protein
MGRPVKVYKAGRCECAIFHNDKYDSYSFKFQKSYKNDKTGEWVNTDFFSDTDMGDVAALADKIRQGRVKEKTVGGRQQEIPPKQEEPVDEVFDDEALPF